MTGVLVTGASGFIGSALCSTLLAAGWTVRGSTRRADAHIPPGCVRCVVGPLESEPDWRAALRGVECVVHLAALVHSLEYRNPASEDRYLATNTRATASLAAQAADSGVRRLVFMSSIKVNGERTEASAPFSASDEPRPADAYALSKWRAEQALWEAAGQRHIEVVIVRPPLVYGPGVGGNFARLMRLLDLGVPLPFAAIDNRRSLVFVDNLVDLLMRCLVHPDAPGNTFLVSDGEDVSTPALMRVVAECLGKKPRLFALPASLLRGLAALAGRSEEAARLLDSLTVNTTRTSAALSWRPPYPLAQGIARTAAWYRQSRLPSP